MEPGAQFGRDDRAAVTWERVFDAIDNPILVLDREQRVIRANATAARRVAVRPQKLIGRRR